MVLLLFVFLQLSFVVSHPDHHSLPKDDYLLQPVWDLHRRPGCLLREMGFQETYHNNGQRSVLFPRTDGKRQQVQLVTDIWPGCYCINTRLCYSECICVYILLCNIYILYSFKKIIFVCRYLNQHCLVFANPSLNWIFQRFARVAEKERTQWNK